MDQNGNNMLTNKKDGEYFTITEIEVWEVSEISKSDAPSILDSLKKKYESFQNKWKTSWFSHARTSIAQTKSSTQVIFNR